MVFSTNHAFLNIFLLITDFHPQQKPISKKIKYSPPQLPQTTKAQQPHVQARSQQSYFTPDKPGQISYTQPNFALVHQNLPQKFSVKETPTSVHTQPIISVLPYSKDMSNMTQSFIQRETPEPLQNLSLMPQKLQEPRQDSQISQNNFTNTYDNSNISQQLQIEYLYEDHEETYPKRETPSSPESLISEQNVFLESDEETIVIEDMEKRLSNQLKMEMDKLKADNIELRKEIIKMDVKLDKVLKYFKTIASGNFTNDDVVNSAKNIDILPDVDFPLQTHDDLISLNKRCDDLEYKKKLVNIFNYNLKHKVFVVDISN